MAYGIAVLLPRPVSYPLSPSISSPSPPRSYPPLSALFFSNTYITLDIKPDNVLIVSKNTDSVVVAKITGMCI